MGAAVLGLRNLVNRVGRCNLLENKVIIFFEARVHRAHTLRWVATLGKLGVAKSKRALSILKEKFLTLRTSGLFHYLGLMSDKFYVWIALVRK